MVIVLGLSKEIENGDKDYVEQIVQFLFNYKKIIRSYYAGVHKQNTYF